MKLCIAALVVASAFGQGKQNVIKTGTSDESALTRLDPSSTYASRPGSPVNKQVWIMTDKLCDGTGSGPSNCRWNGSIWETIGGGGSGGTGTPSGATGSVQTNAGGGNFGGQSSIFSGGTLKQRAVECASGSVPYTTLNALADGVAGEVPIQTGISGNARWDQVKVSETAQFAGVNGLTVSMGRPGSSTNDEMSGSMVPLMVSSGDSNFWSTRPIPPQLTSTYSIVLNFAVPVYHYGTGTVDLTNGSTTITGHGTTWTSTMTGMKVTLNGVFYGFTYVSATLGTLSSAYAGVTCNDAHTSGAPSCAGNVWIQNYPKQVTAGALGWEVCGYAAQ